MQTFGIVSADIQQNDLALSKHRSFFYCNFVEMYAKEVITRLLQIATVYRVKKFLQDASKPR